MCGICGIYFYREPRDVERHLLNRMMETIAHRGPDGQGTYYDSGLALGHLRLSIIDLNTGDQPICNEDRSIWIVYNGEVYNFEELRRGLIAQGHSFRSSTDTEV